MMRKQILLEVNDIYPSDFHSFPAPQMMESMEGGVRILFNNTDEMRGYQQQIQVVADLGPENQQHNQAVGRLTLAFNRVLLDEQRVIDSVKAFARALFAFIFNAEAHRQDKLAIYEAMVSAIRETTNSWELDKSIKASTYELGILTYNHNLTFYNYAHNQVDFDFEKIKERLLKELLILKLSLD
jgi:hypothetical protein